MSEWSAKRFWKNADFQPQGDGFSILLDGRGVKTPGKRTLCVPTQALAEAVVVEWNAQEEKIDPLTMPMTRAANAALDKVAVQHAEVSSMIAEYGGSDLLCYRADQPQKLVEMQQTAWNPILEWGQDTYGVSFTCVDGVMFTPQPKETMKTLHSLVASQGPFSLTALHDLVSISGSLIIGLAAQIRSFSIDTLWAASIVDEIYQLELWGGDDEAERVQENKKKDFQNASKLQFLLGLDNHAV